MKHRGTSFLAGIMLLLAGHLVLAGNPVINDQAALADLKVGKSVFLVDIGDAKKLNFYLEVIQGTYKGMKDQGVDPDFVLVYIGPSVKYLSTSPPAGIEEAVRRRSDGNRIKCGGSRFTRRQAGGLCCSNASIWYRQQNNISRHDTCG